MIIYLDTRSLRMLQTKNYPNILELQVSNESNLGVNITSIHIYITFPPSIIILKKKHMVTSSLNHEQKKQDT